MENFPPSLMAANPQPEPKVVRAKAPEKEGIAAFLNPAEMHKLGCRYLQFDDTIFALLNDPAWRANRVMNPEHQHEINILRLLDARHHEAAINNHAMAAAGSSHRFNVRFEFREQIRSPVRLLELAEVFPHGFH